MDPSSRDTLRSLVNQRADNTSLEKQDDDDLGSWNHVPAFLIAKKAGAIQCGDWRPICILNILMKLYMNCLLLLLLHPYPLIKGNIQYGATKGKQAIEIIHLIRSFFEIANQWGFSLVLVQLDCTKAFDRLRLSAVRDLLEEAKVPIRL